MRKGEFLTAHFMAIPQTLNFLLGMARKIVNVNKDQVRTRERKVVVVAVTTYGLLAGVSFTSLVNSSCSRSSSGGSCELKTG